MLTAIAKNKLLSMIGTFTWDFGNQFFIETSEGMFLWSNPSYGGDNTIRKTSKRCFDGRDKGVHYVGDYVGTEVILVE
jgi:hypothetical protein